MKSNHKKAQTLAELLITSVLVIILIGSALGAFILIKQVFVRDIAAANFQRDANVIMKKIIKGEPESGGIFRLSEAVSYNLKINSITGLTELHFVGTDGIERWYCLSSDSTGVWISYHHPGWFTQNGEKIYKVPPGAKATLRFWLPSGSVFTNIDVGIDVAVSQNILGKNLSGSTTTIVNIRNHFV